MRYIFSARPPIPVTLPRDECSVVYMCAQSLFKLKPDFDRVLREIMMAFENKNDGTKNKAFLVITEGRKKTWTETFRRRLQESVPGIASQVLFFLDARARHPQALGVLLHHNSRQLSALAYGTNRLEGETRVKQFQGM